MTQLTKTERKKFYTKLLKIVCADPRIDVGFCYYVADAAKQTNLDVQELYEEYIFDEDFIMEHLPELYRIKPKSIFYSCMYWWPTTPEGWQKRINKLHNIIQRM